MRGIAVAKRSRREQVVGVREVPFHGVRYQSHDGGRWQRATMKARVVSESIHPAIFGSKLLVEFHLSSMGLATISAKDDRREDGYSLEHYECSEVEATFAAAFPGLLLCPFGH